MPGSVNGKVSMKKLVASLFVALALSSLCAVAADAANTQQQLTGMLRDFLDGAARGDKAAFERFFAEDVIYTRGVGVVLDRATILKDVAPPKPGEPIPTYDAEEIRFHQSGDVAILNFRLVVHTNDPKDQKATIYYRNTGTFQQRDGKWVVIAWQATPLPENKEAPAK
jgi:uncharacterized protein (TIGR02246 family)